MPRCVKTAHVFEKKWRSDDVRLQEEASFSSLLLPAKILMGLENAGYKTPSPIQLESIPVGRFGRDLLVQAKSGTGKTLVFTVIALESLNEIKYPQVLIMAPTREIALQICDVVRAVGSSFKGLTCNCFIGGIPVDNDIERVHGCQIIVGTPGRLKHLITLGILPTNSIRLLVLDEADVLLESNLKEDLDFIFVSLPKEKQVIATSATYPKELKTLTQQYFRKAYLARINRNELKLLGMVHYIQVLELSKMSLMAYKTKLETLEKVLTSINFTQCLVFCNLITRVEPLCHDIKLWGFTATFISSAKEQCDRIRAIECLKHFKCKVLVTSDVTSRGIDAENVDLVVNFDMPINSEIYFHRCGRAGRYGAKGVAVTLLDKNEVLAYELLKAKHNLKAYNLPDPIPANLINIRPNDLDSSTDSEDDQNSPEVLEKDLNHVNGHSSDDSNNLKKESICANSSEVKEASNLKAHKIEKKAVNKPSSSDKDTNSKLTAPGELNIANEKDDCTVSNESNESRVSDTINQNSISEVVASNENNQSVSEYNATELVKDKNSFLEYLESGPKNMKSSKTAKGSVIVNNVSTDNIFSREIKSNTDSQNDSQNSSEKQCLKNVNNIEEIDHNGTDSNAVKHSVNEIKETVEKLIPSPDTLESVTQEKNSEVSVDISTPSPSNTSELDKVVAEGSDETKAELIPNKMQLAIGRFLMNHANIYDPKNLYMKEFNISAPDEGFSADKAETEQDVTKTFRDIRENVTDFYLKVFTAYKNENFTDATFEDIKDYVTKHKDFDKFNPYFRRTGFDSPPKVINDDKKSHDEQPEEENVINYYKFKSSNVDVCDNSLYSEVTNESLLSEKDNTSEVDQTLERYVFKENPTDTSSSSSDENSYLTLTKSFNAIMSENVKSKPTLQASQKREKGKYLNMNAGEGQHSLTLNSGKSSECSDVSSSECSDVSSSECSDVSSSDEDTENKISGAKKMYKRKQNFKCESNESHFAKQKTKPCNAVRIKDKFNRTLTKSETSESESLDSSQSLHNASTPYFKGSKSAKSNYQHRRNVSFANHHDGNSCVVNCGSVSSSQNQEHSTNAVDYGNMTHSLHPHFPASAMNYGNNSTSALNYRNIASTSQPSEYTNRAANFGNFRSMNSDQERQLLNYPGSHQVNGHASCNCRPHHQGNMSHMGHDRQYQLRNNCCQRSSADWYQMYVKQWQFIHSSLF